MIRRDVVLGRYDREMRRDPVPDPGGRVDRVGPTVRVVGAENRVIFSDLNDENARWVVTGQASFFRTMGEAVEWKVFGYDRPFHLEVILAEAGFVPEEPETLLACDLEESRFDVPVATGVDVRRVTGDAGVRDARQVAELAFGRVGAGSTTAFDRLVKDSNQALFVGYAEGRPVASGRLEMTPGRAFAGLWGGGTVPGHRHRGVYRSLVAARAALARDRGYQYLTVDARMSSRPTLERLGFVPLTTIRAWTLRVDAPRTPPDSGGEMSGRSGR